MTRFIVRFMAAALVLVALLSSPLVSQSARAADEVTVNSDEITPDFPNGMIFKLNADGQRQIERIELLYQSADLQTFNLEAPDFTPSKHVDLTHEVDFRINFEPIGVDITYHWRFVDDQGNAVETQPKKVLWSDNRFDWKSVSSTDVTVYAYNQNEAFNKIILDSAQKTVDRLKVTYGVDFVTPIRIWVYNSKNDFVATQQGNSSEWIGGTAYPALHVILAILPEGNKQEVGRIIPHEISHQILNQATKNPFNAPPTWFDEGLAVSNQDSGNETFPAMVNDAAEKGQLFSITALVSNFPYDAADAALAYAESYSVITFIKDHYGEDKLAAVIAAYRTGVSHDDALKAGLGVDMKQLDQLWKESLNYQGDKPRAVSSTKNSNDWDGLIGAALSGGALIIVLTLAASKLIFRPHRRKQDPANLLVGPRA